MAQGFPDVEEGPVWDTVVNIVASGPSAEHAPLDGLTVAVNGSIRLFREKGAHPTWWAGCDPQACLADFLTDAPKETIYLVASKCDRAVFDCLPQSRIRLWHVDDVDHLPWSVMCASTITLTTLSLFRRKGYRKFRVWGWDGCYLDGRDHVRPQVHKGDNRTVIVGDQRFETTTTWALEAQDAVVQLSMADYQVEVMGPGMIGAILRGLKVKAVQPVAA